MKELSIEEKAKAYDGNYKTYTELINRLEDVKEAIKKQNYGIAMDMLYKPYPAFQITTSNELKESENDKIKKDIIQCVKYSGDNFIPFYKSTVGDMISYLEKQGEQKPINKVEPKFHDGDWVVSPNGVYWHIDKISNNRYEVTSNTGESSNWPLDTNIYHKFTIQDAKDGDIIIDPATQYEKESIFIFERIDENNVVRCYVTLSNMQTLRISNDICNVCGYADKILYTPASKEQRDLLFQKMHEAGYEWDAENKQLRKIKQKPAWSEEDIYKIEDALFRTYAVDVAARLLNKIKSIRPQKQWKPSDEQMEALLKLEEMHVLEHEKTQENAHLYMVVKSLMEQLLKLREE